MKNVFILLLSILLFWSCANMPDMEPVTGEVDSRTIDVPGAAQDDLYIIANSWMVDRFVSAESVIEFQDKEAGMIKGKYVTSISDLWNIYNIKTTVTVQVKEEKARIVLADPYIIGYGELRNKGAYDKAKVEWSALIDSFAQAIKTQKASW